MENKNNNWRRKLNSKGYFIIKNLFDDHTFVEETKSKITTKNVQVDMLNFVKIMINQIGNKLNTEIDFLKFRVSNNNNSVDAGGFHRDVICLKKWYPILTCLTYLDDAVMEVIESSHKLRNLGLIDSTKLLRNTKQVKLKSGDVMVFYSTLLHRGVFTNTNSPNRRLVQVFDCFEKGKQHLYNELTSVLGKERNNELLIRLHKIKFTSQILNMFSFYNFISGTSKKEDKDFANKISYSMLSSEGLVKRWKYEPFKGKDQLLNVYIINPDNEDIDNVLPEELVDQWQWLFYKRQIIYYSLFAFLVFIILIIVMYFFVKKIIEILKKKNV